MRYLAEGGLLSRLVAVSAVSGGSVAAAAAADRWTDFQNAGGSAAAFQQTIDEPFRRAVTSKNLRRRWMIASLASVIPFTGGRGGAFARTLAHNLYEHRRLAELPARPEIIFTSTDLSKGHAFRAASAYIGSWDYGYIEPTPTSIKLSMAVGASAAFPPSLTVVNLRTRRLAFPRSSPPRKLSLVDGGVYDNLGLEWFQGWGTDALRPASAVEPTFVIVANASGLLEQKNKKFWPIPALPRELSIQYQQVLSLRIRWNHAKLRAQPGSGIYLAIKDDPRTELVDSASTAAALPSELVRPLAFLRTDLDRFDEEEANLLSYHAYWTLHARLAAYAPELAIKSPAWTRYANLPPAEIERLRTILEIGAHRFFRRVRRFLHRLRGS